VLREITRKDDEAVKTTSCPIVPPPKLSPPPPPPPPLPRVRTPTVLPLKPEMPLKLDFDDEDDEEEEDGITRSGDADGCDEDEDGGCDSGCPSQCGKCDKCRKKKKRCSASLISNEFLLTGPTTSVLSSTSASSTTSDPTSDEAKSEESTTSISTTSELSKTIDIKAIDVKAIDVKASGMIGATPCPTFTSVATLAQSPYVPRGDVTHTIIANSDNTSCWLRRPGRYYVYLNLAVKTTYGASFTGATIATFQSAFTVAVRFSSTTFTSSSSCPTTGQLISATIMPLTLSSTGTAVVTGDVLTNVSRTFLIDIFQPTYVSVGRNFPTTVTPIVITGASASPTIANDFASSGGSVLGFVRVSRRVSNPCNPWGPF